MSYAKIKSNPALLRAYNSLNVALISGSDRDLVHALNIYIDLCQKQGMLVETAKILRDNLQQVIDREADEPTRSKPSRLW